MYPSILYYSGLFQHNILVDMIDSVSVSLEDMYMKITNAIGI